MKRIVILASGSGSNAQAVIEACQHREIDAKVVAVICNVEEQGSWSGLAGHRGDGPSITALRDTDVRAVYDRNLAAEVAALDPDIIVLAGWMLILAPPSMEMFPGRIINVHPALLPDDAGDCVATSRGKLPTLRGAHAVRDALRARLPITGATVHLVTQEVDSGPVLLREEIAILADDDEASLHARIKEVEHRLLPQALAMLIHDESVRRPKEESWETA